MDKHINIRIVFKNKYLPLALINKNYLKGGIIYKVKGKNPSIYVVSDIKTLIRLTNLINGHMRTPKIVQLHKLIDRIYNKNYNIYKLPIDSYPLKDKA